MYVLNPNNSLCLSVQWHRETDIYTVLIFIGILRELPVSKQAVVCLEPSIVSGPMVSHSWTWITAVSG